VLTWPHHHSSAMGENTTDAETITLPLATLDLEGIGAHLMRLLGGWDGSLPSFLPWNIGLQNFMDLFDMISIVSL